MDDETGTELQIITPAATAEPIPAFTGQVPGDLRQAIGRAVNAWLLRTPSPIPAGPTVSTSTSSSPPAASRRMPSSTSLPSAPSTSASGVSDWRRRHDQ